MPEIYQSRKSVQQKGGKIQPQYVFPRQVENVLNQKKKKVIITMVIRPLDDPTRSAQSVVADLQPLGLRYVWGRGWARSTTRPWVPIDTCGGLSLTFCSYLASPKSVFARPSDLVTHTALEATGSPSC